MRPLVVAFTLSMFVSSACADNLDPLTEHRWTHRVLLAFANDEVDSQVTTLRTALAAIECELKDRDMIIGWILADATSRVGEAAISKDVSELLRSKFGIQPGEFAVFLIGKDGGVKAGYDAVPELKEVFARIDGMPMRRAEMRSRTSDCAG